MNSYNKAAFNFSKAYQMQTAAADAQHRANQNADMIFEDMADNNDTNVAAGQPQGVVNPTTQLNGFSENKFNGDADGDLNLVMRAKRRVSKYLGQNELV